ncbi:MAG: DUF308 domain-containing protein [Clostridia bacterium]|nr:DUF308 domain-containing protein [Clostridia bacterium]
MKNINLARTWRVLSLSTMVAGLLFIIWPDRASHTLCYLLGAVCLIIAGFNFFFFGWSFKKGSRLWFELTVGLIFALCGILCIAVPDLVMDALTIAVGAVVLIDGLMKLFHGVFLKKRGAAGAVSQLVFGVICVLFGVFLIVNPSFMRKIAFILAGVALLFDSAVDNFSIAFLNRYNRENL